jgi:hypothetical protein
MMALVHDPRVFNYLILALSAMAAVRLAFAGDWWQAAYWAGAVIVNSAVTFRP